MRSLASSERLKNFDPSLPINPVPGRTSSSSSDKTRLGPSPSKEFNEISVNLTQSKVRFCVKRNYLQSVEITQVYYIE